MSRSAVHITGLGSYRPAEVDAALDHMLEGLGGLGRFVKPGQRVLIKPNIIAPMPLSQTHKQVIVSLGCKLRQFGANPFIGDSPAWGSLRAAAAKSGLAQLAETAGIEIKPFRQPRRIKTSLGWVYKHLTVDRLALDADVIISVPKLKSHKQMKLTAGVKNMMGCVPGKRKAWWHFRVRNRKDYFAYMLLETYLLVRPALTIIDAVDAMEGNGPLHGQRRKIGALIGSSDAVAAEAVCCKILNLDPSEVPVMRAAEQLGVGQCQFDRIVISGEDPLELQVKDFDFGQTTPVGFSLPQVARSVIKNLYLLAKQGWRRIAHSE